MSYLSCSKTCWNKLFASVGVFSSRINAQTRYDIKQCWSKAEVTLDQQPPSVIKRIGSFLKSVVQTIKVFMIILISLISYVVVFALAILRCLVFPCPFSNKTPKLNTEQDIIDNLRTTVNKKLSIFERVASLIFTPFKETGFINSWDEYNFWIMAQGEIINVAYSWDGFETIDIKLNLLTVFRSEADLQNIISTHDFSISLQEKYIRIEVKPQVLKTCNMPQPITAKTLIIKGQLLWDRDGFLEIHPKYGSDLMIDM
jgi:hypothetical protein